jgi:tetratricopeptide (TPR) repeat protein
MTGTDLATRRRLEAAVRAHRAGRVQEAAAAYDELLRRDPDNADVMQRFGTALAELGRTEEGAQWMARSLELKPDRPTVLINLARALHILGRDEAALRCGDRAVSLDGTVATGYRVRAAALTALGRREEALASSGEAVRLAMRDATAHLELGVALDAVGRSDDALACFAHAITLDPNLGAAHHHHGILSARKRRQEQALRSFDRALALQPYSAAVHSNRGNALMDLKRLVEAVQSYDMALAIEPSNPETLHNRAVALTLSGRSVEALRDYDALLARHGVTAPDLIGRGTVLVALRRFGEAVEPLQNAIAVLPGEAEAHIQLGVALLGLDRSAEAAEHFERALAIRPDVPEVLTNHGVALAALGRTEEALERFRRALSVNGGAPDTHVNIGVVQKAQGRNDHAGLHFELARALQPDHATAEFELAMLNLSLGHFKRGWSQYESRFRVPALAIPARQFRATRWDGTQPLAGKTLLIHAEQGLGDTLQFCRYLPRLVARGATVVFEVMPALKALMGNLPGGLRVLARGEPVPPIDFHCPLLSLPLAFDTDLATIPAEVPYLSADPVRVARWAPRVAGLAGLKVGIAWQGNPGVERLIWAQGRSIPLAALAPLAALPGVNLVSLQKGAGSEQLPEVPFRHRILDLGPEFDGGPDAFVDAAAVMSSLDLVLSSDTSIAHLAGSLGRPVWTLLHTSPDWRWLLGRGDSPWYPTMRLFRQAGGGWCEVVGAVAAELASLAAERGATESV